MDAQHTPFDFTLSAPTLRLRVDVRLRRSGDRWVARADAGGTRQVGLAESPGKALAASLAPLGRTAVTVLLADLGLLEPSLRVAAVEAGVAR